MQSDILSVVDTNCKCWQHCYAVIDFALNLMRHCESPSCNPAVREYIVCTAWSNWCGSSEMPLLRTKLLRHLPETQHKCWMIRSSLWVRGSTPVNTKISDLFLSAGTAASFNSWSLLILYVYRISERTLLRRMACGMPLGVLMPTRTVTRIRKIMQLQIPQRPCVFMFATSSLPVRKFPMENTGAQLRLSGTAWLPSLVHLSNNGKRGNVNGSHHS